MLHAIGRKAPPTGEVLDALLDCHARLRHFSALAVALATRDDLDEKQIADACDDLLRYFQVALPLHEADEEVTLAPVLAPLMDDGAAIERMRAEHVKLHATLGALFPFWEARAREKTPEHARDLASIIDAHLTLEETAIFPLIAKLPAEERKRLHAEMRARRTS